MISSHRSSLHDLLRRRVIMFNVFEKKKTTKKWANLRVTACVRDIALMAVPFVLLFV